MDKGRAILDAALELFAEHGYSAVGVDRIGTAPAIPGPHIYRHFSGKDELLATLIDQSMDRLLTLTAVASDAIRTWSSSCSCAATCVSRLGTACCWPSTRRRRGRSQTRTGGEPADASARTSIAGSHTLAALLSGASAVELEAAAHGAIGHIQSVIRWPRAIVETPGLERIIERDVLHGLGTLAATVPAAARPAAAEPASSGQTDAVARYASEIRRPLVGERGHALGRLVGLDELVQSGEREAGDARRCARCRR